MACPCVKDTIISESDIEETCDKAMHNTFKKIDFILSVIGDDVKEYIRTHYDVDSKQIQDSNYDQLAGEGTSEGGMNSKPSWGSDYRFQQEPSVSFSYFTIRCEDRGAYKKLSEQKLQGGRKRRHFSAAGGGAPRGGGKKPAGGGLSPEFIQRIRIKLLGSSGSADTMPMHSQGQRAGKRTHGSSEREEGDCGQSRGKQMSDIRFQETYRHFVSPGGGALEDRGAGGDVTAMRSHCKFPEISNLLRLSKKEEVGAETADSERNNNSPEGGGGERERVVVEKLNPPF